MEQIEMIYNNSWLLESIYRASDKLVSTATDQTKFEERAIRRIIRYLNKDKARIKNRRLIRTLIYEELSDYERRYKKEESINFSNMSTENQDEEEMEFEPEDVLTDVESEIITKETIALLTQDDRSKKVLEAWSLGNTNNTEISRMLTHTLGGKAESHRKFIQRFEKDCREKLATAI